jgi:hypothetical protein
MKIQIVSDLHLEMPNARVTLEGRFQQIPDTSADLLVLAGDIVPEEAEDLAWILEPIRCPIVWVLGNHEWYRRRLLLSDAKSPAHAAMVAEVRERFHKDLHLLEEGELALPGGWRVLGTTWWPAMDWVNRDGEPCFEPGHDLAYVHDAIHREINDFKYITVERAKPGGPSSFGKAHIDDLIILHRRHHRWLRDAITAGDTARTIVVTHYVPTNQETPARFRTSELNPYFRTPYLDRNGCAVPLWICGHTHESVDVRIGATRVVANPAGYGFENNVFRADLTVEVG